MSEKNMRVSRLYDYYGPLLTEKQRYAVELYYNDDLSLAEIAETTGITRQGVRDQLKHAEEFLNDCEDKLGLVKKLSEASALADKIADIAISLETPAADELRHLAEMISEMLNS